MIRNQNPELMMNALKKAEYKMEQIENRMENKFIVVAGITTKINICLLLI